MTIQAEDRYAITELIGRHGHLMDDGELDRLDQVFTHDAVCDLSDLGRGSLEGLPAIRDSVLALGTGHPVGHHVTNIVLTEAGDGVITARSKGLGVKADGTCISVVYQDRLCRRPDRWRISYRKILLRRLPLGGQS